MNARTSHLIHRLATVTGQPQRSLKREWNRTPRNKRAALRNQAQRLINEQLEIRKAVGTVADLKDD